VYLSVCVYSVLVLFLARSILSYISTCIIIIFVFYFLEYLVAVRAKVGEMVKYPPINIYIACTQSHIL